MLDQLCIVVSMNRLNMERRAQIIKCLVDGNSIRATSRITGAACEAYQDKVFRDLPCKRIQCDEIWSFCYAKQKNVPHELQGIFGYGDAWTWTAICADTKLVPSWMIGNRNASTGSIFLNDLAARLKHRVQLTTDGHKPYLEAVEGAFGSDIDYAMLVKLYGKDSEGAKRYSPAKCMGAFPYGVTGKPDPAHISTSYAERQNLTMRMNMRRFTRLTNAFSKKVGNLAHSVSLHFMYYNFVRIHKTLKVTPAMAAGLTDHLWEIEDIVELTEGESVFYMCRLLITV